MSEQMSGEGVVGMRLRRNGRQLEVTTDFAVSLDRRETSVRIGRQQPVTSAAPEVRQHQWRIGEALEQERARQERDARPIDPEWKPERAIAELPEGYEVCPWCGSLEGIVESCTGCEGHGLIRAVSPPDELG